MTHAEQHAAVETALTAFEPSATVLDGQKRDKQTMYSSLLAVVNPVAGTPADTAFLLCALSVLPCNKHPP